MTDNKGSILVIGNMAGRMGKGQAVCETLALLLEKAGWRVFIASGKIPSYERLLEMLTTAYKYRAEYSLALIEVFSGRAFIWAEIVASMLRHLKKPYILALYGGNLPNFSELHPNRMKRLLESAKIVISPSGYTKHLMLSYWRDIRIFPYGVDHEVFRFRLRSQPEPVLMTTRAFHRIYNLSMAPKVLAILIRYFPDMTLVMTGGDKHDGSWELVQQVAREKQVEDRIKMLGFVPRNDIPELMNQAGVLLNTPNMDNTPVSLLEAMACGLCIVSTNVGGIPYLLEHEVDALLTQPDDAEAMAAAVRRIMVEPGLAEHLSRNARKKAEQYDWSVVLPKWEDLFLEVLNQ